MFYFAFSHFAWSVFRSHPPQYADSLPGVLLLQIDGREIYVRWDSPAALLQIKYSWTTECQLLVSRPPLVSLDTHSRCSRLFPNGNPGALVLHIQVHTKPLWHSRFPVWHREDREDFDLKAASEGPSGTGVAKRGRPSGGGGHADGPVSVGKRVYVNNLSHDTTWQILKDHFRQAGNVVHAAVLTVRSHIPAQPHAGVLLYSYACATLCNWLWSRRRPLSWDVRRDISWLWRFLMPHSF